MRMTYRHLNVSRSATSSRRTSWRASIVVSVAVLFAADLGAQQESPKLIGGRNVNMAGGLQRLTLSPYEVRGDVLGRAQNEPSCAISTRNPQHILCGSNDYRMVDVPGVTETQLIRDAWLGVFQSADGGDTWESTLYGGFFLDPAAHPLKTLRFQAAADPVVRSGLAGATFYAGIAFTADKSRSALHVSTYLDLNNLEGDRTPFKTVRTTVVHQVRSPQFIDKPWMYVEAGPQGQTCTLPVPGFPNQVVPASTVHVVYTVFLDPDDSTAAIMYTRSTNCGLTFSTPIRLNPTATPSVGLNDHGNGASIAKPLNSSSQTIVATWRRVRQTVAGNLVPDAILSSVSTNNGVTWTAPFIVEQICPFDQGTTTTSFRTTSFPSLTADATGRFYVAWSDRRQPDGTCASTPANSAPIGAARIRIATSTDGRTWSSSVAVPSTTPEHQIQPSLTFTAGRLFLAWLDFRFDASQTFGQFVNEAEVLVNTPKIRHTADVRASMALPGTAPDFAGGATQISEYLKGVFNVAGRRVVGQMQWNAVNRRWARKGTVPFYGDYIDIATMPYLPPDPAAGRTTWTPNNSATIATPLGPVPFMPNLLVAWTDNRDMRAAPGVDNDPDVPVPYTTPAGLALPTTSVYDPLQTRPVCTVPSEAYKTGTNNQNAYAARLSVGFVAAAPGNRKRLGTLQRAFVIFVRNDATAVKSFRLIATPPPGGFASFDQFDFNQLIRDVNVPARSSVARTVFVTPNTTSPTPLNPDAPIRVDVIELAGATPVNAATVMLNGDASAPEIDNPEIDNREVFTPEIDNPEIDNRGFASVEINSPEIDSPEIDNPEIDNATWLALGLGTPEIDNPEIDNPEIDNPEIDNPEIDNPEIDNAAITDARFRVTNRGNTIGQFNAKAFVTPTPGSDFRYQVIVRKTYSLAAVNQFCEPTTITVSKVAVNLVDVRLGTPEIDNPEIDNPEIDNPEIDNSVASFFLGPDESAEVIVRTRSAKGISPPAEAFDLAMQSEAVSTPDAVQGITEAPIVTTFLSIGTTAVPAARTGVAYDTVLFASGGSNPVNFSVIAGALPPGLALTGGGQIAGIPTASGSFSFTVQAADSSSPVQTVTRSFTIPVTATGTAALAFINEPTTTLVGTPITPFPSVRALTAAGTPAVGVNVTVQLVGGGGLTGTVTQATNANGVAVFDDLSINALLSGLALTATAAGFAPATSSTFAIVQPASPTLAFNVPPSSVSPGSVMTPAVEVRALDPSGAALPGVAVSLQLAGAGTLTGTLTRTTAANGIATFNDLVLSTTGNGLALQATATGFVAVTSTAFDVVTTTLHSPVADSGVASEPLMARPVQGLGGDANRDLVVIHSNGLITSMGGNGNGQFTRMFQSSIIGNVGTPRDVRAGAIDGDGHPDLVIAYDGTDTNNLQIASTNGNFNWESALSVLSIPGVPSGAAIAQLNAAVDGAPDIAVISRTTNQLFISEVNQNFNLRAPFPLPGSEPIAIASGQMNPGTDPWTDLVILNRGSRNVTVLLGDGQGGFTVAGNFPLGATGLRTPSDNADALALTDFNEDGILDVAVATDASAAEEGQAVIVLLGNGAGSLGAPTRFAVPGGPLSITTGDFNNDGHIDVATANPAQNNITILHGTGTGSFTSPQPMSAGNTPRGIVAADFTNDGKPEIVVTNRLQRSTTLVDEVTTILNVAAGTGALTVTTTADSGAGSLRAALTTANARAGRDEVSFAIPGAGPHVIALATPLPHITDPIVIDGTTQPGYVGSPQVEINGTAAGLDADGLWIANGNSEIVGLSLTGFLPGPANIGGSAIVLAAPGGGSWVRSNYIGLHASGTAGGAPTVGWGVTSGSANTIGAAETGRNIISGTSFTGVLLGGSGALVMYNRFGTTPDGLASALPGQPQGAGVTITGSNIRVWRNVIANQGGVYITSTGTNVTVQANYIGTDVNGTTILANPNGNSIGVRVDGSGNVIGGSIPGDGNVIGGFGTGVMTLFGTNVVIRNNRIGLAADGTSNLPNVWGIGLLSSGNTVQNNTITAGSQAGIMLSGPTAQDNLITNNAIDQNPGVGIGLLSTAGSRNTLVPNVFSVNGGLAIDLNFGDGPTANDTGDADLGPNDLQNFPVITGATPSTGSVAVSGFLNSTPSNTFILHVFQNTGVCSTSGRGEGQALLGSFAVITDANGSATFAVGLSGNVPVGAFLSATATNATGSTSEFSPCFTVPVTPVTTNLAFATQPTNTAVGETITPAVVVQATDGAGQPVSGVAVTLILKGGGTLSGTLTRTTGATGLATFNDLSVSAIGTGNTLVASASGFAPAASAVFDITTAAAPPVANGLVSWWRAENNAVDSIGSNDGTLINGATFGAGQFGQAFQLDGSDDFVDVGPGYDLDALTLSTWVFIDPATNVGNRTVLSKDDAALVAVPSERRAFSLMSSTQWSTLNNNRPAFTVLKGEPVGAVDPGVIDVVEAPFQLTAGWHHLAGVRDQAAGRFEFYIDGVNVGSTTPTIAGPIVSSVNVHATIGAVNPSYPAQRFTGRIDEPQIFNRALSAAEIAALYHHQALVVTNTGDTGPGSLREALTTANAITGTQVPHVVFNIPGAGTHTIAPLSPLPVITRPVVIDASTQPGYAGAPIVEISGGAAGPSADGLVITGGGSLVRGLVINAFGGNGIVLQTGGGNQIAGNYLGTTLAGTAPSAIGGDIVLIQDSVGNLIGGNVGTAPGGPCMGDCNVIVARGFNKAGVNILGATSGDNRVLGNFIGTNALGTDGLAGPNNFGVIISNAPNASIGDGTANGRNVISGNNTGIVLSAGFASIAGNYIGTNAAGTAAPGNAVGGFNNINYGVSVAGGHHSTIAGNVVSGNGGGVQLSGLNAQQNVVRGNYIGVNAAGTAALPNFNNAGVLIFNQSQNNIIGGTSAADRNVISGNFTDGVALSADPLITGNRVIGNYIGTNAAGTAAIPNGRHGVLVDGAVLNFIGGNTAGERNVIAGNTGSGVQIQAATATNNVVVGNFIGTNAAGTAGIGNTAGGVSVTNSSGNSIGDGGPGQANVIAFNGAPGVIVSGTATNNRIVFNSMHHNAGIGGIDLGGDGVTANDAGDADAGPNNFQNHPVVTSATATTVTGTLNSAANTTYMVQLFVSPACHPSGFGEGQVLAGTATVTTDASGNASFTQNGLTLVLESVVTATATDPLGNTSEFSACRPISAGAAPLVVTNTNDSGAGSLRQALIDANANTDSSTVIFAIPGGGPYTIQPTTPLPTVTSPIMIDGTTQPGFNGTPIIELSGALAGAAAHGLVISGGNSAVRGLVVTRWSLNGIYLHTVGNNVIAGNYLGTDGNGGAPSIRDQVLTPNPTANNTGVRVSSPNNRIGGTTPADRNIIAGNTGAGVAILPLSDAGGVVISNGTGTIVQGNYFGTDATGTTAKPNGAVQLNAGVPSGLTGQSIFVTAPNVTIGGTAPGAGNLISANTIGIYAGVTTSAPGGTTVTSAASSLVVQGNLIGTDVTGSVALPINVDLTSVNAFGRGSGIEIFTPNSIIGGAAPGAGNVISGNAGLAILVDDLYQFDSPTTAVLLSSPTNLSLQGNKIGTNSAGTAAIGGSGGYAGIVVTSQNVRIGGTAAGAGNVISGNLGTGIQVAGYVARNLNIGALNTIVEGNYIGVNVTGTAPIANQGGGIVVGALLSPFGAAPANSSAIIGGSTAAARNIISGNGATGVTAHGILVLANSIGTQIQGNYIGTDATGATAIGNLGSGIQIEGALATTIGGLPTARNVITGNTGVGVVVQGTGTGNSILANSIFNNGGLGIDLAADGVTSNDTNDTDAGPNNFQNFPVITAATTTSVFGALHSTPNTSFTVHIYVSNTCDASGFGEGQQLLDTRIATTDAAGNADISAGSSGLTLTSGQFVTATATDPTGNTSEFSACVVVSNQPVVTVVASDATADEAGPDGGAFTFSRTGPTTSTLNVTFTVTGTATTGVDYVGNIGTLVTFAAGQASTTVNFTPILDALIEENETVVVTLTAGDYVIGTPNTATATITENTPTVSVAASDATASESGLDSGSFTFTRTGPTVTTLSINVTLGGTATAGTDYANTIGTLVTIPAGQSSATVTFTPSADGLVEGPETVTVTIGSGTYVIGAASAATATITDTSTAPQDFSDNFEGAQFDPLWGLVQQNGTAQLSTERAHSGIQSLRLEATGNGQKNVWLTHAFSQTTKGILSVWFYDPANGATLYSGMFANNSADPNQHFALNVADWNSSQYVWNGPGVNETSTSVPRTPGWHEFTLRVTATGFQALIDSVVVGSVNGDWKFDSVLLLLSGPSSSLATFYFDEFSFTSLDSVGQITGVVRSAAGAPLANAIVQIVDPLGDIVHQTTTNAAGIYLTGELSKSPIPGVDLPYYARVINAQGFLSATYGCTNVSCAAQIGTPIFLAGNGATTSGVDFNLVPFGSISGTATAGGAAVNGSTILVFNADEPGNGYPLVTNTSTAANGTYTVSVAPGRYYVRSLGGMLINGTIASPQLYNGVDCVGCLPSDGTMVVVSPGAATSGINFNHAAVGGRITGTVTDAGTGSPLSGVTVLIFTATGEVVQTLNTNASGVYGTTGLPNGQYFVRTASRSSSGVGPAFNFPYIDELYGNIPCALTCAITTGTPVTVSGTSVTGIDLALSHGGQITGTVIDATNGEAVANTQVHIFGASGQFVSFATTNDSGVYFSTGLPDGTYYLRTNVPGEDPFIDTLYGGQPCLALFQASGPACDVKTGAPVIITGGANASGINFALNYGAVIMGRVTNEATSAPLPSIAQTGNFRGTRAGVGVYDAAGRLLAVGPTDQDGRYVIRRALPPGAYFARTFTFDAFIDEALGNVPCLGDVCDVLSSTPIVVTPVITAADFVKTANFALAAGGAIESTIVSGTGAPTSATIEVYTAGGQLVSTSFPPIAGVAVSRGLPPGNYFVKTTDSGMVQQPFSINGSIAQEVYDNLPCPPGCAVATGTPIALTANTTTPINITLNRSLGRIQGYVVDASTNTLLNFQAVEIYNSTGTLMATAMTRIFSAGYFASPGLPPGNYYLRTRNTLGYPDVLYNGQECVGECNVLLGTPVTVVNGQPTAGIVLALGGSFQPVVTIISEDPLADEVGDPGSFTLTRTGSTANDLVVHYIVSGTATNGVDYDGLPGVVTIPAGQSAVTLSIEPVDDGVQEPVESVVLTLAADPAYAIGVPDSAVVAIESDVTASVIEVTTTNDSGPGSLRQAIIDANAAPDLSILFFTLPGTGPFTIQPTSPLPAITAPTYIIATTQPGFVSTPIVELSGASAGADADGLVITSGSTAITGLVINRWSGRAIYITGGGGNVITANYIGTDVTGTIDLGNGGAGAIHIVDSPNNFVGGNLEDNLISGNDNNAIRIEGALATNNVIVGNRIGVTSGGDALGNTNAAIYIRRATNTQISANLIMFNGGTGAVTICGDAVNCPGPFSGTPGGNASGTTFYGNVIANNLNSGVWIASSPGNLVGLPGNANNIFGNGTAGANGIAHTGVFISGTGSTNNQIRGNAITGNSEGGVLIIGTGNIRNSVQGNTFLGNGGPAIDLGSVNGDGLTGANGVTPNDLGDGDVGPNNYQNFPIVTQALSNGTLQGTLNSVSNSLYMLDFYGSTVCNASGPDAQRVLGSFTVTTDANGNATFSQTLATPPAVGEFVTATATDQFGNTSEFSACVQTGDGGALVLTFEDQADSIPVGTSFLSSYNGVTFTNWQHYAPYPAPYQPNGINAIFAAVDGARFTFTDRVFVGASFSRFTGLVGAVFFELYQDGVLVHTSSTLPDSTPTLTFLASGYAGLVDEVRVRSLGGSMTTQGSAWIIDDITFQ